MSIWFEKTFLPSFEDCESKKISGKQFNVFARELKRNPYERCVVAYYGEVSSRYIEIVKSYYAGNLSYPECYLTIRTIDESAADIWERWERHYEDLYDTVESDGEAEQIESYIMLCHHTKQSFLGFRRMMTEEEAETYLV